MTIRYLIGGISVTLLSLLCEAASIDRVEPPFWWQGFAHRNVQLLVHGEGIAEFDPSISYDGLTISKVERGDSPNYLFINVAIEPTAPTGSFDISFSSGDITLIHRYALLPRADAAEHVAGFSTKDVIYLITPDRFANGDPSNDTVDTLGDPADRSEPFGRHGGDLQGLETHLGYIAEMGFTSIWVNPLLENAMPESSYHGYATTDFYKVDPRFGSNEEYRQLVAKARELGLGVIMDMIVNHAGSKHWWMDDPPTFDWINYAGRFHATNHARTTNQDPYASDFDKTEFTDGWFAPAMPDLNQRNPLLANYLIQNSIWWTEYLGLAGIRQDTYPYPDKTFMSEWARRLVEEYPHINIVGEEWSPNPAIVSYWQAGKRNHDGYVSHLPSLMDFPLQTAFASVLTAEQPPWGSIWTPVYEMLGNDFQYPNPSNLVIFPDNHDMSRLFTQVSEDYDLFKMAMVFYLTMRGIPQIYYGTEILLSHPGTDSHGEIRSDFPGGWAGDVVNAFDGSGLTPKAREAQQFMRKLLHWRKSAAVIHDGKLMQFAPIGNVYAYFRYSADKTVMVIFNLGHQAKTIEMSRFEERIANFRTAVDVVSGKQFDITSDVTLEARSVLLLELDD